MSFLSRIIAVDIETIGEKPEYALQAYRYDGEQTRIRAISYAWVDETDGLKTHSILDPTAEGMWAFFELYKDRMWVGWNVCFDVSWFLAAGLDIVSNLKWLDAMLLWRHVVVEPESDEVKGKKKSYALKAAMKEFYPEYADFKDFEDFQTTDPEKLKLLLNRNRMDAAFTLKLADRFWSMLTNEQRTTALIESACIPMVAETFNTGLRIDVVEAEKLQAELTETSDDIYESMVLNNPEIADIDLGSPKQLSSLLYDQWGLTVTKQTEKGANSTDKEALTDLADLDPRASQLRDYREAVNTRVKFVDSPLKSQLYNGDGYTRPQAKIFGTYTGRVTYYSKQGRGKNELPTGIAIHQWPRDKRFRKLICPPVGYTLLEFDFAGQEFRWMAVASRDETMLSLCAEGEDAHAFMGGSIAGVDYRWIQESAGKDPEAKKFRNLGKFCIAEGELVLTDRGLIPIEKVLLDDAVWDGVEWVLHTGVVYQGVKEVITYEGLTATPDHIVFLADGSNCFFIEAAKKGYPLAKSQNDDGTVRQVSSDFYEPGIEGNDNRRYREPLEKTIVQTKRVYDITNAGPRNRFTVSGKLVHNCNLSYQYRIGAKSATIKAKTQYGLKLDENYIASTLKIYKQTYTKVPQYWRDQIQIGNNQGYVSTFAGRRVQLTGAYNWQRESTCINYPIQGSGADQKYLALAIAKNHIGKYDAHFYKDLHDGLFFICPNAKAEGMAHEFRQILSNLPYKQAWGRSFPIRFPVDAKMSSKSWGDLEELKGVKK